MKEQIQSLETPIMVLIVFIFCFLYYFKKVKPQLNEELKSWKSESEKNNPPKFIDRTNKGEAQTKKRGCNHPANNIPIEELFSFYNERANETISKTLN